MGQLKERLIQRILQVQEWRRNEEGLSATWYDGYIAGLQWALEFLDLLKEIEEE